MKKTFLSMLIFTTAALLAGCGAPAGNNAAANKPTNAANSNSNAAPAADKAAVEGEIRKMMDEFTAALNKNDADAVAKFYADDYVLVDQNGASQTKASRLEQIRSGKIKWEGLKFTDLKIRTHPSGDGAVIVGHASGKTMVDGKSEDRNSVVTWVAGKSKDKGWQFLNAQITDVKGGDKKADDSAKADDKKPSDKATSDDAPKSN
jgi:uncharacterized protein (TIGR02246 family)